MSGFQQQVKDRAKDVKSFFKRGVSFVKVSWEKGWHKVKKIKG